MAKRPQIAVIAIAVTSLLWCVPQAKTIAFEGASAGERREIGGIAFAWAPPGTFRMGSPLDEPQRRPDEGPVTVTLSHGFWIGKYEITQGQWKSVMGTMPREQDRGQGDDVPVYWVSFLDAEAFCSRLTTRAHESGKLPSDWEIGLPTEAQWEYACRAGTKSASSFGEKLTPADANIGAEYPGSGTGNREGRSHRVGSYRPNAWGLYDMHGNVWEYCRDWYHRALPGGTDPDLSGTKGERNRDGTYSHVRRGGAWVEPGWACRSAMRLRYEPHRNSDHIGFRIVAVRKP